MEALLDTGLVKHIGVSNFPVILLHELLTKAKVVPFINQCECHPYLQQQKLIEYCKKRGIHFQAYSPLGASSEYRTKDDLVLLDDPILQQIATKYNVSTAVICLSWAIQRGISVVVKSSSAQHQHANYQATQIKLSDDDMAAISKLDRNYRYFRPEEWWDDLPVAVFN